MSHALLHPALETVRPRGVAEHFDGIRKIPRRSGNEAEIGRHIVAWAEGLGLVVRTDANGNVAVDVPASPGCEGRGRIIMQGHMDMVCVAEKSSGHDFAKDPIDLEEIGGKLQSRGRRTTLGADNGMGMALAMALAEDGAISRPPLTILITVDEEAGMTGAERLEKHMIPEGVTGFINLDAEEGPQFVCNGSASGHRMKAKMPIKKTEVPRGHIAYKIELSSLKGGHSGADIEKGHGNAIALLGNVLRSLREIIPGYAVASFSGGSADNVIPNQAECIITVPADKAAVLAAFLDSEQTDIRDTLGEPGRDAKLFHTRTQNIMLITDMRDRLLGILAGIPTGPLEWIDRKAGLVSVSNNIGVVTTNEADVTIKTHTRNAIDKGDRGREVIEANEAVFRKAGAEIAVSSGYGGWQEPAGSPLVTLAENAVRDEGYEPVTFAYHAGLECAVIRDRMVALGFDVKNMSCVAIGPEIKGAHGVTEAVDIKSIGSTYKVLVNMMEKLAA